MNLRIPVLALIISTTIFTTTSIVGCNNSNLKVLLSEATEEIAKHKGVILYVTPKFSLVRVKINGVNYIANSMGGLVKEE